MKQALISAFTSDFPSFTYKCGETNDSSNLCSHPTTCSKATLSITSYYLYNGRKHLHLPHPSPPQPIFYQLCQGCTHRKGECTEGCRFFANKLWGYTVFSWDFQGKCFHKSVIEWEYYNLKKHSYFHYKTWRTQEAGAKQKHRDWERDTEQRKKRKMQSETDANPGVSHCAPTSQVPSTSPEL